MFQFERKKFFDGYRSRFGPLSQQLVDALEFLLGAIEGDTRFGETKSDRQMLAYCLATFKWETAHTMKPIDEYGGDAYFNRRYGPQTRVGRILGNTEEGDGARFHGRGYVQLTGRSNYRRAGALVGLDLIAHPERAKDPPMAYRIATQGMVEGWFTGRKLGRYFVPGQLPDYEGARALINGHDQDQKIADIARRFDEVLASSL